MKPLLLLAPILLLAGPALAQVKEPEIQVAKDKVLEACATQRYESVLTDIDGLRVRFFCDPYMPPLLLNAPGSSADKKNGKPGPAISETLPECPPTDKAYGLCEMTRLDRELRRKMMEVQEKKSYERLRAAEERAALEETRKKLPPPPPPCTPLNEVGIFQGMTSDILGAGGYLMRIMPIPGDVRLVYQIRRTALYGPMSRVKEGELVSVDAIASRSQFAVPVLPSVTVTKAQAGNLCLTGAPQNDAGATSLAVILRNSTQAKSQDAGKLKAPKLSGEGEEVLEIDPKGPITLPHLSPSGPTPIVPPK
ncbi:MAG: hypothetical protein OEL53_03200 [Rhodospirillales bacterium]|nr:hypothetical protein [Rhodospirillales bacterium]